MNGQGASSVVFTEISTKIVDISIITKRECNKKHKQEFLKFSKQPVKQKLKDQFLF
jgi:hypothetical protein